LSGGGEWAFGGGDAGDAGEGDGAVGFVAEGEVTGDGPVEAVALCGVVAIEAHLCEEVEGVAGGEGEGGGRQGLAVFENHDRPLIGM
jgi:hypothetical protein